MSPERLIQGRRAKVIATLVAGAEFLGAPGAVAQNPTPQPEAQSASVQRTQILPESPYAWVYTAPWLYLSTPSCRMEGPKPEPTPNIIPAADANVSAQAQEAPKPSLILARQTMSDGSTVICTLPPLETGKPEPTAEPTPKPTPKPKSIETIIKAKVKKTTNAQLEAAINGWIKATHYPLVQDNVKWCEKANPIFGGDPYTSREPYCTILVEQSYGDYIHTGSNKAYKAALTARNYLLSFMPSRYNEASVLNQDLRSKFK